MARKLQNKRLSKTAWILYKDFSIFDASLTVIIIIVAGIFSFANGLNLNNWVNFIIFILLNSLMSPLIIKFKKHNAKGYIVFVRWIKFVARPKKYTDKNRGAKNSISLVPNISIKDNQLMIGNYYVGIMEVFGRDISFEDPEDQMGLIHNFAKLLNELPMKSTIIKLPRKNDLTENQQALNEIFKKCESNTTLHQPWIQNLLLDQQLDIQNNHEFNQKFRYFVVFYEKSFKELNSQLYNFSQSAFELGIVSRELNLTEKINLQAEIYNVDETATFSTNNIEEMKKAKKISKFLTFDQIQFKANSFVVNKNLHYSIQTISNFGINIDHNWIQQFFNSDSVVIWHLKKITDEAKEKILSNAYRKTNASANDEKDIARRFKGGKDVDAIIRLMSKIADGQEELFDSSFYFLNRSFSSSKLKDMQTINLRNLKKQGTSINALTFRQFEAFSSIQLKPADEVKEGIEQIATNIAFGWPFADENFNDGNNNLIGHLNSDDSPIFFDIFKTDAYRKNSNMFILGTSGSGKSTFTKKIMTNNYLNGAEIILLDPQNEYAKTGKQMGANIINIGSGKNTVFNPLQLQKTFDPKAIDEIQNEAYDKLEEYIDNVRIIDSYESKIAQFFSVVFPDFSTYQIDSIAKAAKTLYFQKGFDKIPQDATKLPNDAFPIIDDLIVQYEKDYKKINYLDERSIQEVIHKLNYEFGKSGRLRNLYNGHTNFKFDNTFTIFNVAPLLQESPHIYQAGFYLILNFIQAKISENLENFYSNGKRILLVIDEAHKFIDEKNIVALDFIYTTIKTIRKFGGGLVITTQNPKDFAVSGEAERKSQAIIDNCQYSAFFQMKSNDIQIVDKLYKSSGGLTINEKSWLTSAKTGEFLFSLASNRRFLGDAYYNSQEKEMYFDQGDKREH